MLEQLNQIIRQFGQEAVVNNNSVANEHNEGVMQEAQDAIFSQLQSMAANGQVNQLTDLLQNANDINADHPAVQNISNNFLDGITSKFGINKQTATQIAAMLIPMVLSQLSKKANDPNDNSFSLPDILGSVLGGGQPSQGQSSSSPLSEIGKSFLDRNKDGNVDLKDIIG